VRTGPRRTADCHGPGREPETSNFHLDQEGMMNKFLVTFFDDVYARSLRDEEMTLRALHELIFDTCAPTKEQLPLLKLARFGAKRSKDGCLRHDPNVLGRHGDRM
jgi:hypothetical protein